MTRAVDFAKLVSSGTPPDTAFILLTIVATKGAPSVLDSEVLTEIRELVKEYAKVTGQESLLWGRRV